MISRGIHTLLLSTVLVATSTPVYSFDLSGTLFEKAGVQVGLDPKLIYSIALAESAYGKGNGTLGPHPWTLRSTTPTYAANRDEAEQKLRQYLESGRKGIDVGIMQINVKWNGHRVASPLQLLDPATNVMLGAQILSEAIKSSPNDLELGIGRYHHWTEEDRSRNYGARILAIYQNLLRLSRGQQ